jgi:penicillin-binding protein 2
MFEEKDFGKKFVSIQWLVALSFLFLILRLWQLQIIRGSEYLSQSIRNRTRLQKIQAPRGFIVDMKGQPIVKNTPVFNVYLIPQYLKNNVAAQKKIANILSLNPTFLKKNLAGIEGSSLFVAMKAKENISRDELGLLMQDKLCLPGVIIDVVPKRFYSEGCVAAHLLGYLGEASKEDLGRFYPTAKNYRAGDFLGKTGVERAEDEYLRGLDGYVESEVDASGQRIRILTEKKATPGKNVFLTVDLDLQRIAEESLGDQEGALVALDPRDGRVLAMVSHPSFDPGLLSQGIAKKDWRGLLNDPACPLINRAIHSQLPPGSVYKIISVIAALEEGAVDVNTSFYCPGYLQLGKRVFGCWKKEGHGRVNLKQAIVSSCDVYFYQLGLRLGVGKIEKYARLLGLGAKTGIELEGEKPGLIPSCGWKKEKFGSGWSAGEIASLAIGQGYNLVTPLQAVNLYATIANGGTLYRPQFLLGREGDDGRVFSSFTPRPVRKIPLSTSTLEFVKDALWGVVNSPQGTGWRARVPGVDVAGKTGTAQVVEKGKRGGRHFSDHAWFVAFAPKDSPEIAVVAVVEHGGHGGAAAAPVVQRFILGWIKNRGK